VKSQPVQAWCDNRCITESTSTPGRALLRARVFPSESLGNPYGMDLFLAGMMEGIVTPILHKMRLSCDP
jgi:hypothetical protein